MGPRNHVLDGGPEVLMDVVMATNVWLSMGYNFGFMIGGTENARLENAELENAARNCRSGKCETGKGEIELQDWKKQDWKTHERIGYGKLIKPKQATRLLTRPDSSLRYRRYINYLLTYLLTYRHAQTLI